MVERRGDGEANVTPRLRERTGLVDGEEGVVRVRGELDGRDDVADASQRRELSTSARVAGSSAS